MSARFLPAPMRIMMQHAVQRSARKPFAEMLRGGELMYGDYSRYGVTMPNPDDLAKKKGLKVYEQMDRRDEMVASCIRYRIYAGISTGWEIEAASDDPEDQKARDYQLRQLDRMQGSTTNLLINAMDILRMGLVVGEKVYQEIETEGDWSGKQGLHRVAWRDPTSIEFNVDEHGEFPDKEAIWQKRSSSVMGGRGGSSSYIKVDRDAVFYHVHDPRYDNPYGRPPGRAAYRYYFIKEGAWKLWALDLERFGLPIVYGETSADPDSDDVALMKAWLRNLREGLVGVIRPGWKVQMLERKNLGEATFQSAIQGCNRGIARAWQLPELIADTSASGGGAYALGEKHGDTFEWVLSVDRDNLADAINADIIEPTTQWNFRVGNPPKFRFKPFHEEDLAAKAQVFKIANAEIGIPLDDEWVRKELRLAPTREGEETIPGKRSYDGPPQVPGVTKEMQHAYTEMLWEAVHKGGLKPVPTITFGSKPGAQSRVGCAAQRKSRVNDRPLTAVEQLIDFEAINALDDDSELMAQENLGVAVESIARDVEEMVALGKGNGDRPQK